MITREAEIRGKDPQTGEEIKKEALLAVCDKCDNREWIVFQIKGHDHFHLQCSICGETSCPKGGDCH